MLAIIKSVEGLVKNLSVKYANEVHGVEDFQGELNLALVEYLSKISEKPVEEQKALAITMLKRKAIDLIRYASYRTTVDLTDGEENVQYEEVDQEADVASSYTVKDVVKKLEHLLEEKKEFKLLKFFQTCLKDEHDKEMLDLYMIKKSSKGVTPMLVGEYLGISPALVNHYQNRIAKFLNTLGYDFSEIYGARKAKVKLAVNQ